MCYNPCSVYSSSLLVMACLWESKSSPDVYFALSPMQMISEKWGLNTCYSGHCTASSTHRRQVHSLPWGGGRDTTLPFGKDLFIKHSSWTIHYFTTKVPKQSTTFDSHIMLVEDCMIYKQQTDAYMKYRYLPLVIRFPITRMEKIKTPSAICNCHPR